MRHTFRTKLLPGTVKRFPAKTVKRAVRQKNAAERRRDKKIEERAKLLSNLSPARDIPVGQTWVAIITKHAHEHHFAAALEARTNGFCVLPMRDMQPRRKPLDRRPKVISLPLLPRVVFAGFPTMPNWLAIESLPYYAGKLELIVGVPAYIPERELIRLRDESERDRLLKTARKTPVPGDLIRVQGSDEVDVIESLSGKYAILKRMMLGQNIRVELSRVELMEAA